MCKFLFQVDFVTASLMQKYFHSLAEIKIKQEGNISGNGKWIFTGD